MSGTDDGERGLSERDQGLRPITLPLLALRLTLYTAWHEAVQAGMAAGPGAHAQADARVEGYVRRLVLTAQDLAHARRAPEVEGDGERRA